MCVIKNIMNLCDHQVQEKQRENEQKNELRLH